MVERPSLTRPSQMDKLFMTRLVVSSELSFDYTKCIDGLNILFPYTDKIIHFTIY